MHITICSSNSSWSAPIIIVPKGDARKCLIFDYRALNKVTQKFLWHMLKVEDIFSKLNSANYFSMLNLHAVYHHMPLDKDSIPQTAFTSPFGTYEYLKVHFGLAEAPAYFQELMNKVLKDLPFLFPTQMILLSTAKLQKNTWTIYSKSSTNFAMQNYI